MVPSSRTFRAGVALLFVGGLSVTLDPSGVAAQLIPVRTVPVASGDQFRLLPSQRMGMGSVQYAVDDSLADGWTNPARGGRLSSDVFLGSPTFYGISDDGGAGRSFPVAGLFTGGRWFGGASLALQQVENVPEERWWGWWGPCCGGGNALSDRFGRNVYVAGYLGRRIGDGPWTVGLGVSAAALQAMDGVDLLYAGAQRIDQSGQIADFRIGVDRTEGNQRFGAILAHNRVSMTHDVSYEWWEWDDSFAEPITLERVDVNEDRTRTWAGHLSWDRKLSAEGWRIGAVTTLNHKSHPKIPNYSIQNIPRDPGTTWAFEAGFGISRSDERTSFALDVALQPIWSDTWQEADSADVVASDGRLAEGDRSIENDFFFTNVLLRTGVSHRMGIAELQAGLDVRSYGYTLEQVNWVEFTNRDQTESWVEWSPTFGASVSLDALDLRYAARITNGTGRPGLARGGPFPALETLAAGFDADFILAPGAPLDLEPARVITHQISVVIPIR